MSPEVTGVSSLAGSPGTVTLKGLELEESFHGEIWGHPEKGRRREACKC